MTGDTSIDSRRTIPLAGQGDPALLLTPTRHGLFLCNRHDIVGVGLVAYGEWAEPEVALMAALLRPGDVVIECGANIGALTVPMARAVAPRGVVHAIELQPYFARLLNANLALNGIANVQVRQVAAGAAEGMLRLPPIHYDRPVNFSGLSFAGLPTDGSGTGMPVQVRRLDDMYRDLGRLKLLKMDIETMEPVALAGATDLIRRFRPLIYCECRSADAFGAIRGILGIAGYRLYWHAFRGFSPANFRGNPNNRFGDHGDLNLLALPPDMPEPSPGLPPARDFGDVAQLWPGLLGPEPGGA